MNNFNKEIETLAQQYEKAPIFDGIVNEKEYQNSKVKILWILKDANSTGEDDSYDLREAIGNLRTKTGVRKGWEKTFNNIIYVTNAILNKTEWENTPYPKDEPEIVDVLKQIAYINVKKVGGGSQSVDSELYHHYEKSKELLLNQINEFDPDVIIFGNTYRFFKNDLDLNEMNVFGTCHATAKAGRIYINAYHPNARINGKEYFEDILKAYHAFKKQIDNIKKNHSDKSFENDINVLTEKIKDSLKQTKTIEDKLFDNLEYGKLANIKSLKIKLEQALNESKNI